MKISVNGIRRSGNHAIAIWFLYHFNGGIEYFNNWVPESKRKNGELYLHKNNVLLALQSMRIDINFSDNVEVKVDNSIYGLENFDMQKIRETSIEKDFDYNVIILRDPINNIASLIKYADKSNGDTVATNVSGAWGVNKKEALIKNDRFLELWKDYAKNAINYDNNILLIYDKWFSNEQYRRDIENLMNLPNNDKGLNKMHFTGNGSSFDNMDFQNDAQNMNVLNRWEEFVDNEEFMRRINDTELLELREEIFGPLPFVI